LVLIMIFLAAIVKPTLTTRSSRGDLAPVALAMVGGYLVLAVAYPTTDASFQLWPWLIAGHARVASIQATAQHRAHRTIARTDDRPRREPGGGTRGPERRGARRPDVTRPGR
jgi:hypothetical protein